MSSTKLELRWHDLKEHYIVYFKDDILSKLISKAIKKAGGINALSKELRKLSIPFDSGSLSRMSKRETKGISVKRLKGLCSFLSLPFNDLNKNIEAIGGGLPSIRNIKFPINFDIPESGRLFGAITSDGGISKSMTFYSNFNKELRNQIIEAVKIIFGDVSHRFARNRKGRICRIYFNSHIMSDILVKFGAPTGRKTLANNGIPDLIKEASLNTKIAYFQQVFSDEGDITKDGFVRYSRSLNITSHLTDKLKRELERIRWKNYVLPDGSSISFINYTEQNKKMFSPKLRKIIENNLPKLLQEEMELLKDNFKISTIVEPTVIRKTKNGYTTQWCLRVATNKDILKFYNTIGFGDKEKQKKFKGILKRKGLIS